MTKRTLALIAIGVLFAAALCAGAFTAGGKYPAQAILDEVKAKYEASLKEKDTIIQQREMDLKASQARYTQLTNRLAVNKTEIEAIKPPATNEERRKRLEALGLHPH